MNEAVAALMKQGTIGGIFLAVLLIALVYFAGFTRKMISEQLAIKDKRIEALETKFGELSEFVRNEHISLITGNEKVMQRVLDTLERLETTIAQSNRR